MTAPFRAAGSGASLEAGLEQFKRDPRTGCLDLCFRIRSPTGQVRIEPFKDRSWGCPTCGPAKGRATARAARLACEELGLDQLLTLTLPGRGDPRRGSPRLSRESVARMWNALRTRLVKSGFLGSYLAVPEWQKDGTAHLHTGVDREIPHAVLSEAWGRLGGGFVWVSPKRKMRNAGDVGRYLAKYLTKASTQTPPWDAWVCRERGPGSYRRRPWRRFWASRDVGAAMRSAALPPVDSGTEAIWDVVVPVEWPWGTEWVPFASLNRGHAVPGCDGHVLPDWGDCHHAGLGWKCECGPPEKALRGSGAVPSGSGVWDPAAEVPGGTPRAWRCLRCEVAHVADRPPTVCAPESGGGCGRTVEGRLEGDEIVDWTVFLPAEWTRDQVAYYSDIEHAAERSRLLSQFEPSKTRPEPSSLAGSHVVSSPPSPLELFACGCRLCVSVGRGCRGCPRCREEPEPSKSGRTWR